MTEQIEAAAPQKRKRETRKPARRNKIFEDVPDVAPDEEAIIGPGTDAK